MARIDRIYQLHRIFEGRRSAIPRDELEAQLECSRSTVTRLIREYRDTLGAPLEFNEERRGYCLNTDNGPYELPGLWFSADEIHALLTSHRLLANLKPGLFEPYVAPLRDRLESLLKHEHAGNAAIFERIRILPMASREVPLAHLQKIAGALMTRRRLRIQYSSRDKEELTERWVSPQRLVYYRANWYLDAWCHLRDALRTFSMDRMNVSEQRDSAVDIADQALDDHFTQTYGIFAGPATHTAVIRFSDHAARWVADEQWHPEQLSQRCADGRWEITVPYGDPRELVRDILKYGPDAEVMEPTGLRALVAEKLCEAAAHYKK
ncbi:MAG: WYL domain-containing protein [Pseudohongiellaceae bacterium]